MRLVVHLASLLRDTLGFSAHHRSATVAAVVVLGIAAVALALVVQVAAPVALYPFL